MAPRSEAQSYASSSVIDRIMLRGGYNRRYRWPVTWLMIIMFIFFVSASTVLGIFAYFTYVQKRMWVEIPWYFYFLMAISIITFFYIGVILALYYTHRLLPVYVFLLSFVMFVLWLTGLIKASIELWGPMGSINDNCTRYVFRPGEWGGRSVETLARIQQEGVCNMWKTSFALELITTAFMFYLLFLAHIVWSRRVEG